MKKLLVTKCMLLVLIAFLLQMASCARFCNFYNENDFGTNKLVSKCVLPNGDLEDNGIYQTSGRGDGKGLIGNDRVIAVGECLFASNDVIHSF